MFGIVAADTPSRFSISPSQVALVDPRLALGRVDLRIGDSLVVVDAGLDLFEPFGVDLGFAAVLGVGVLDSVDDFDTARLVQQNLPHAFGDRIVDLGPALFYVQVVAFALELSFVILDPQPPLMNFFVTALAGNECGDVAAFAAAGVEDRGQ
ncbi:MULTISPECIES: hypothetical protein [Nocardia]|uniref:hypothetical protein n=1 Tax=Nocardia TaxID=1817 RepID=UPI000FE24298|nr:hypothetical protein [Nocardia africana]MCC3317973.1 hypothetical protein [Nocardia africana]